MSAAIIGMLVFVNFGVMIRLSVTKFKLAFKKKKAMKAMAAKKAQ